MNWKRVKFETVSTHVVRNWYDRMLQKTKRGSRKLCTHLRSFHTYYEKICRFFFSLRGRAFRDSTISAYGTNPIYSPRIFPSMGDGERVSLLRGNSALKFRAGNPLKSVGCLMGARSQRQRRLPTPYLYLPSPTRAQKDAESETQNALAPACGFRRKYLIPTRWREMGGRGGGRWQLAAVGGCFV